MVNISDCSGWYSVASIQWLLFSAPGGRAAEPQLLPGEAHGRRAGGRLDHHDRLDLIENYYLLDYLDLLDLLSHFDRLDNIDNLGGFGDLDDPNLNVLAQERTYFLEQEDSSGYLPVFRNIRLPHLINHHMDVAMLVSDRSSDGVLECTAVLG